MGHNDLCRARCNSLGSQASLRALSSWTNASLLALSFGERRSKHRPPKENARRPVRFPQQNGGITHPLSQPRKPLLTKYRGRLRGRRHRGCFLRRSLRLARLVETQSRNRALRLHRCLRTIPKFPSSTGMPRCRRPSGIKGAKCALPFSLFIGTDAWVLFIICRPVVQQVQEKVFSSDAFQDLDLHPHLVSISQWFVWSTLMCLFIQHVCEMRVLGRKTREWVFLLQVTRRSSGC